jgi:single-stranded DNA-binding protein
MYFGPGASAGLFLCPGLLCIAKQNNRPPPSSTSFRPTLPKTAVEGADPVYGPALQAAPRGTHRMSRKPQGVYRESFKIMSTIAEFKIIGRVGAIKEVGSTVRVSIASSYSRKDQRGDWIDHMKWNEVTIFNEATQGFVQRNLTKGDLVYASGALGQTSYEKAGERVYGVTLAVEQIERLAKANGRQEEADDQSGSRAANTVDSDIAF